MKRFKLLFCLALTLAALTVCALAAKVDGVTITHTGDQYTVTYTGADLVEGNQYILLVVEKQNGETVLNEDTVQYINQAAAADDSGVKASFTFTPRKAQNCELLLGGVFKDGSGTTSPKTLGVIRNAGANGASEAATPAQANTVKVEGTITIQGRDDDKMNGAVITFTPVNGSPIQVTTNEEGKYELPDNLPIAEYTVTVKVHGFLSYTRNAMDLATDDGDVAVQLIAGDIDDSDRINATDLNLLISAFNANTTDLTGNLVYADFDGGGRVNASDLSLLISNLNQGAIVE